MAAFHNDFYEAELPRSCYEAELFEAQVRLKVGVTMRRDHTEAEIRNTPALQAIDSQNRDIVAEIADIIATFCPYQDIYNTFHDFCKACRSEVRRSRKADQPQRNIQTESILKAQINPPFQTAAPSRIVKSQRWHEAPQLKAELIARHDATVHRRQQEAHQLEEGLENFYDAAIHRQRQALAAMVHQDQQTLAARQSRSTPNTASPHGSASINAGKDTTTTPRRREVTHAPSLIWPTATRTNATHLVKSSQGEPNCKVSSNMSRNQRNTSLGVSNERSKCRPGEGRPVNGKTFPTEGQDIEVCREDNEYTPCVRSKGPTRHRSGGDGESGSSSHNGQYMSYEERTSPAPSNPRTRLMDALTESDMIQEALAASLESQKQAGGHLERGALSERNHDLEARLMKADAEIARLKQANRSSRKGEDRAHTVQIEEVEDEDSLPAEESQHSESAHTIPAAIGSEGTNTRAQETGIGSQTSTQGEINWQPQKENNQSNSVDSVTGIFPTPTMESSRSSWSDLNEAISSSGQTVSTCSSCGGSTVLISHGRKEVSGPSSSSNVTRRQFVEDPLPVVVLTESEVFVDGRAAEK
ncbi:hypothetical protein EJ08DRAFT_662026 [Tothia fuscella]|uniref:Uncharacterized protein n=1 Tax=Tothia fuscella TaxID=1048955 RepID=A0A9P4TX05_9PEZI|nr:hypothetical protein EJ08DRAFT_662026 [Tothia fuscella]